MPSDTIMFINERGSLTLTREDCRRLVAFANERAPDDPKLDLSLGNSAVLTAINSAPPIAATSPSNAAPVQDWAAGNYTATELLQTAIIRGHLHPTKTQDYQLAARIDEWIKTSGNSYLARSMQ